MLSSNKILMKAQFIIYESHKHRFISLFWFFRKFVESTEKNITIFISAF